MKYIKFIFILVVNIITVSGLYSQEKIEITKVYSQNMKYYLRAVPYQNDGGLIRGKSSVYESSNNKLLYSINRYFEYDGQFRDVVATFDAFKTTYIGGYKNFLTVSNDGRTVAFYRTFWSDDDKPDFRTFVIYRNGILYKSYSISDITKCDLKIKDCKLIYTNWENDIDRKASQNAHKTILKQNLSEKESFLINYPVFTNNDIVYITDPDKIVHRFDLTKACFLPSKLFDHIYTKLKLFKNRNKVDIHSFSSFFPLVIKDQYEGSFEFPHLRDGKRTALALGEWIDMKPVYCLDQRVKARDCRTYYEININAYLKQDGKLEIEKLEVDKHLPYNKVKEFFQNAIFDNSYIPQEIDKWYYTNFFWKFRNKSDDIAAEESLQIAREQESERQRALKADTINGHYIPQNLNECFIELDKILSFKDKNNIKNMKNTISLHMGLGMWLRNNWCLWRGSRLSQYFLKFKVDHPDEMSGTILDGYQKWLLGNKSIASEWETRKKTASR